MIIKAFEIEKKFLKNKIYLFYGKNDGQKKELIKQKVLGNFNESTFKYSEREIFSNLENFYNTIQSQSFFEKEKLIIISETSDKILKEIEKILEKNLEGITIILLADILEKNQS